MTNNENVNFISIKLIEMLGYNRFDERTTVVLNIDTYQQLDMLKFDIINFRIDNTLPDEQFVIILRGVGIED